MVFEYVKGTALNFALQMRTAELQQGPPLQLPPPQGLSHDAAHAAAALHTPLSSAPGGDRRGSAASTPHSPFVLNPAVAAAAVGRRGSGTPLGLAFEEAGGEAQAPSPLEAVFQQIGEMLVGDLLLNNNDRFRLKFVWDSIAGNAGNVLLTAGSELVSIDHEIDDRPTSRHNFDLYNARIERFLANIQGADASEEVGAAPCVHDA